jgi:uncharacterized protein YjbI with pentapeptide repeats
MAQEEPMQEYKDTPQDRSVQVIWAVVAGVFLLATLIVLIVLGYIYQWEWVGVGEAYRPKPAGQDIRREKTLWDWMQLLIIPVAVAVGTFALNQAAKRRDDKAQEGQKEREKALQRQRAEDATLQAYIEYMAGMLTDPHRPLRRSNLGDDLSLVARAQTLTALGRLQDGERKRSALQFLYEARLINDRPVISLREVDLRVANFQEANLQGINLQRANLQGANLQGANLQGCALSGANLQRIGLEKANLQGANLLRANLQRANLEEANLQGANLQRTTLIYANLSDADLQGAVFFDAWLQEANLQGANLQRAKLQRVFLPGTNLSNADLQGVNFQGVTLHGVDVYRANLQGADLRGCDLAAAKSLLSGIKNLAQWQVNEAIGDEYTKLPRGLTKPSSWTSPAGKETDK